MRAIRMVVWVTVWLLVLGCALWAFGALYFDLPAARGVLAWAFAFGVLAAIIFMPGRWSKLGTISLGFALVLGWWLTLQPSNTREWQPDVAQAAWAEVNGDEVILHNVRNWEYRTETDHTPQWETRTVRLSQITGIDLAICYWGSPWMAHPIASFQFADAPPVCFSIETRKETGESYSAIGGLYRQFELTYIVANESDVIRVRCNFREGESVYLYRTTATPELARERFLEYLRSVNRLRDHPAWYNAITTNCTTNIRDQHPSAERIPWDWRLLLNGKADELMFERGTIASGGLPFQELKKRALIGVAPKSMDSAFDFSKEIRIGRPGF